MNEHHLQLKLTGEISPASFPLGELISFLHDFQSAIECEAHQRLPGEHQLALTEIKTGSVCLGFAVFGAARDAGERIVKALAKRQFRGIHLEAQKMIRRLCKRLINRDIVMEFRDQSDTVAVVSKDEPPPEIDATGMVRGGTTLFGRVIRVGGERKPSGEIHLLDQNSTQTVKVTKVQALRLAEMLYQVVVLDGIATWRVDDNRLMEFRVDEIHPGPDLTPANALTQLAGVFQKAGVDPLDGIREQRVEDVD